MSYDALTRPGIACVCMVSLLSVSLSHVTLATAQDQQTEIELIKQQVEALRRQETQTRKQLEDLQHRLEELQYNVDDADHLIGGDTAHAVWLVFEGLFGAHPAHTY